MIEQLFVVALVVVVVVELEVAAVVLVVAENAVAADFVDAVANEALVVAAAVADEFV